MPNKDELIQTYLEEFDNTDRPIRQRNGKFDRLFGDKKNAIINLIIDKSVPIKVVYDDLVKRKIIEGSPYISFYQWVKRKMNEIEKNVDDMDANIIDNAGKTIDSITRDNVEETAMKPLHDSRDMFYGFDMNSDPDIATNPLPQMYEISKEYIFNIFKEDNSLNNEKIVYILLYEISERGENIFKEIWPFMLIKNGENIQQYYDRLQDIINSNGSYSFGITNATACISDIAFSCGYDGYKIIRRKR